MSAVLEKSMPERMGAKDRLVIFASSLGTIFEWYDFFLAGALAPYISKSIFSGVNPTAAFIFTLLSFAAGFAVRPLGAVVFGRLGDKLGRKYTFMVTIVVMGASTFFVGLLPGYATIGLAAPIAFVSMRLLQGLALGGEYGGAATYVAEHAPSNKRGAWTSWIQMTATLGLFLSLLVVLVVRTGTGENNFASWGWRIPFLLSIVLVGVSVWIRMMLSESPVFQKMHAEGNASKAPIKEAFGQWKNVRLMLIALFGVTAGEAVVWYTGQFYTLFFLNQTLKVDGQLTNLILIVALLITSPFYVVFGTLSDRIGRKRIMLAGCLLAVFTYIPLFKALTHYANPMLEQAQAQAPIVLYADPEQCSFQFNPVGTARFTSPCDVAKAALSKAGVGYENRSVSGTTAFVEVGGRNVRSYDAKSASAAAETTRFNAELHDALTASGYPLKADPAMVDVPMTIVVLIVLMLYGTMVYGPMAAMLVECFPTRIRYTCLSVPYHVGNGWFGGFLPASAFAIVAAQGNIYSGLWYPVVVAAMTSIVCVSFVKETVGTDVDAEA